jgi:hypothetical protein
MTASRPPHYFNFKTEPTFHFYWWIRRRYDTKALIDTAFEYVNKDIAKRAKRKGKREADPNADDIAVAVQGHLAKRLQAILEDIATALQGRIRDSAEPPLQALQPKSEEPRRSRGPRQWLIVLDSFALPLTAWAMDQIHVDVVAEALLRDAGKWKPDESDPEEPTEPLPDKSE